MNLRNSFLIATMLTVMLVCVVRKVEADSSPSVEVIYAKGNYVFLDGYAHIKMIDGKISRLKDDEEMDVRVIEQSPEGYLWGYKGRFWGFMRHSNENSDSYFVRYDGKELIKYAYPSFPWGSSVAVLFPSDKTIATVTVRSGQTETTLYLFDGSGFRELTRAPERTPAGAYAYTSVSGDEIVFNNYHSTSVGTFIYSIPQDRWQDVGNDIRRGRSQLPPRKYGDWRNYERYQSAQQPNELQTITNPEGKVLTLRPNEVIRSRIFDLQGNCYMQSELLKSRMSAETIETRLWTDRNGEWENIVSYNRPLYCMAVSDNAERTLWGSDGGCYLAFLRDGKWIEVALLHAVIEPAGPGSNMDPMREAYGDNGMSLAVIDDADGYVNVRANPSANAPIKAIILEDVTFMYETLPDNPAWVKVLLPSGTKGYLSSSRFKHLEEEPIIYYDDEE